MKKAIFAVVILFFTGIIGANAQIVGASDATKSRRSSVISMYYGASAVTSVAFNKSDDIYYGTSAGVYGDLGWNITPRFSAGFSLGLHHRALHSDFVNSTTAWNLHLLAGLRYYVTQDRRPLFIDYRAGVNLADPLESFGRKELGIGICLDGKWEVAAGPESELWAPTVGANEIFKYKGIYIRAGYRFR